MRYIFAAAAVLLAGCSRLPRELRSEIGAERSRIEAAQLDVKRAREAAVTAAAQVDWTSRLRADDDRLTSAENMRRNLEREEDPRRAEQILTEERRLREGASTDARAVEKDALHWIDVKRNMPRYLARAEEAHDLAAVTAAVEKAEVDWPAKKSDLESRLSSLKSRRESAEARLKSSGNADVAAVIELEKANPAELRAMAGQLYDSWDKILEDLDSNHGVYREKLKTVRTRFTDVAAKKTDVSSDVDWVEVPESSYRAVEKDLGMAVSHKDAGLYDSEAKNIAQPPGYAYIAPPSVGSNQYGYWTHGSGGSFWTFLPQYLIMRELFWGRSYQPIVVNEYNRYYEASRAGRSYYGVEAPNAPPKYGTHGTFTQQRYASSRYVQTGGFRSSGYASRPEMAAPPAPKRFGFGSSSSPSDSRAGKRFGSGSGSPSPSGRRFGSPSAGRRFGGRR